MISNSGNSRKFLEKEPQVRAVVLTFFKPFALQVSWQFFKQSGNCSPSVKVTLAPQSAATTPGNAVPDPSYMLQY